MKSPFIVAELSANHGGYLDHALELVDAAATAGADAIKLQTWEKDSMVLDRSYVIDSGPWKGRNLAELYDEAQTPWAWHPIIFERARRRGMEAFSTPFDLPSLAYLQSIDCPRYKVASFEITDLPLIRAIAQTRKPMFISTGMATETEIWVASLEAMRGGCDHLTVLKCTSAYPADVGEANLATMLHIKAANAVDVGLSDHTLGHAVAVAATVLGATVIEKHLTLRRADGGPDAEFSMEPDEFALMVKACQDAAASLGRVVYGATKKELPQLKLRRSIFAARDIPAGHIITADDLTTARPAIGAPMDQWDWLIGGEAKKAYKRGDVPEVTGSVNDDNVPHGTR